MTLGMPRGRQVGRLMPPLTGLSVSRPVRVPALRGFPAGGSYAATVIASKPAAYWRLDEATGVRAYDQMHQANGTYVGGIAKGVNGPPGITDGAAVRSTAGAGTYVECGANVALSQSAYTLACWVFPTSSVTDDGLLTRWNGAGGAMLWIDLIALSVTLVHTATAGNWLRNVFVLPLARWTFVVGTWDGSTLRVYQDGVLRGSKAMATAPAVPGVNWRISGYSGNTSFLFTGSMAEAAYWNRALPAGNIAHLYAIGSGRF